MEKVTMTDNDRFEILMYKIKKEMGAAEKSHGPFTLDFSRAMLLIGEEYGEAVKATVEHTRRVMGGKLPAMALPAEIYNELLQMMALTMLHLINIERNYYGGK